MTVLNVNEWNYTLEKQVCGDNLQRRNWSRENLIEDFELPVWQDDLFWEIKKLIFALANNIPITKRHFLDKQVVEKKLPKIKAWNNYIQGGGKMISLYVSDLISKGDKRLIVPNYTHANVNEKEEIDLNKFSAIKNNIDVKIRTSHHLEDWLIASAGFFGKSAGCSRNDVQYQLNRLYKHHSFKSPSFVIQKYISECVGLVINIGWSEVLQRNIARVATGRYGESRMGVQIHTNATRDVCGAYEVWCPEKGEILISKNGYGDDVKPYPGFVSFMEEHLGQLISALYKGLKKLDINFGVEFEILIHHEHPDIWNLVQTRPCPDSQRNDELKPIIITDSDKYITATPIVNMPFNVTGNLLPINRSNIKDRMKQYNGENILLWTEKMLFYGLYYIEQMAICCRAQIYPEVLYPNSKHDPGDLICMCCDDERHLSQVLKFKPLLSLSLAEIKKLEILAREKDLKVRMISDGLICGIYLLN